MIFLEFRSKPALRRLLNTTQHTKQDASSNPISFQYPLVIYYIKYRKQRRCSCAACTWTCAVCAWGSCAALRCCYSWKCDTKRREQVWTNDIQKRFQTWSRIFSWYQARFKSMSGSSSCCCPPECLKCKRHLYDPHCGHWVSLQLWQAHWEFAAVAMYTILSSATLQPWCPCCSPGARRVRAANNGHDGKPSDKMTMSEGTLRKHPPLCENIPNSGKSLCLHSIMQS